MKNLTDDYNLQVDLKLDKKINLSNDIYSYYNNI
jgi:hypothetical protein